MPERVWWGLGAEVRATLATNTVQVVVDQRWSDGQRQSYQSWPHAGPTGSVEPKRAWAILYPSKDNLKR